MVGVWGRLSLLLQKRHLCAYHVHNFSFVVEPSVGWTSSYPLSKSCSSREDIAVCLRVTSEVWGFSPIESLERSAQGGWVPTGVVPVLSRMQPLAPKIWISLWYTLDNFPHICSPPHSSRLNEDGRSSCGGGKSLEVWKVLSRTDCGWSAMKPGYFLGEHLSHAWSIYYH